MSGGLVIGIISAVLQSFSYVFSRKFMLKYASSGKLAVYSQIWMMLMGGIVLLVISPWQKINFTPAVWGFAVGSVICAQCAYFCFFRALQEIEASRLSALQGLKMIALAGLNAVLFREYPSAWQWAAILLASFAAAGMNFSGGRLPWRGLLFLGVALFSFAGADIAEFKLTRVITGSEPLLRALAATAFSFFLLGISSSLTLIKTGFDRREFVSALPYAACWFCAISLLLASFDMLGVMLGAIIQSGRGIFSVLIGYILLKCNAAGQEPPVPVRTWCRRAVMAAAMILAMFLYMK